MLFLHLDLGFCISGSVGAPAGSFNDYILVEGGGLVRCTLCNKTSSTKSNLKKHIENIHFPGAFTYTCRYCGDTFSTKNNHYLHVHRVHNNKAYQ